MSDERFPTLYEVSRSTARGLSPLARCGRCPQPIDTTCHPFDVLADGLREYRCGVCGYRNVLYSAAWLGERSPASAVRP